MECYNVSPEFRAELDYQTSDYHQQKSHKGGGRDSLVEENPTKGDADNRKDTDVDPEKLREFPPDLVYGYAVDTQRDTSQKYEDNSPPPHPQPNQCVSTHFENGRNKEYDP